MFGLTSVGMLDVRPLRTADEILEINPVAIADTPVSVVYAVLMI